MLILLPGLFGQGVKARCSVPEAALPGPLQGAAQSLRSLCLGRYFEVRVMRGILHGGFFGLLLQIFQLLHLSRVIVIGKLVILISALRDLE